MLVVVCRPGLSPEVVNEFGGNWQYELFTAGRLNSQIGSEGW